MTKSSPSLSPPISSSPGDGDGGSLVSIPEPASQPPIPPVGENLAPVLDLVGEVCPFTFVRAKLALEALPLGALLRVIVDHEPATRTIPRSAREWGQDVVSVISLSPSTWAIDLRKRVR
jgi:TusA-related sulfurtransferase